MYNKNYCLITGASEGFGKALAIECASRNLNIILVALPGSELVQLAGIIKINFEIDVIPIEMDLCKEGNCMTLFEKVTALNVRVNMLVNNAGIGSTLLFSEGSIWLYQKQIQLNIMATTLLTRLFVDMLYENRPAYILNVGSLCCFFFLVKKHVYGATKSYIYFFSKCLRNELRSLGIQVSVVCPGAMNTNLSVIMNNRSGNWLARQSVMNPEKVASITIDGLLNGKAVIIPGRINKFFLLLNQLIPNFLINMITNRQMYAIDSGLSAKHSLIPEGKAANSNPFIQ